MSSNAKTAATDSPALSPENLQAAINLRLAQMGFPWNESERDNAIAQLVAPILARQRELNRRLSGRLSATDARIQNFLQEYLGEVGPVPALPRRTLGTPRAASSAATSLA